MSILVAETPQHGTVDLWLLLLLADLGARRYDAVQKLLRKKFAEGHADHNWLDRAFATHPVRVCYSHALLVQFAQQSSSIDVSLTSATHVACCILLQLFVITGPEVCEHKRRRSASLH